MQVIAIELDSPRLRGDGGLMRVLAVIACLFAVTSLSARADQMEVARADYYAALFELVQSRCPDVAQQVDAAWGGFVDYHVRNEWTQEFEFEPTLVVEQWPFGSAERHALAFELAIVRFSKASVNVTGHISAGMQDAGPQNETTQHRVDWAEASIAMLHCLGPNNDDLARWSDDRQHLLGSWARLLACEPFWTRYADLFDLARTRVVDHTDVRAVMVDVSDQCEDA